MINVASFDSEKKPQSVCILRGVSPYQHCEICENREMSPEGGFMCGITKARPAFDDACDIAVFETRMKQKIEQVNADIEIVKEGRIWIFIQSAMVFALGAISSFYGAYTWYIAYSNSLVIYGPLKYTVGSYLTPVSVFLIGLVVMFLSVRHFRKHLKEETEALEKRKELGELLSLYGLSYEIDLFVGKERHGHRHISSEIKMYKN